MMQRIPRRTAYIGAYGYGNLGDELCLIEAMRQFPPTEAFAFSVDPAWTNHCVPGLAGTYRTDEELLALGVERVVFGGGGIGTLPGLARRTAAMMRVAEQGATTHIHNIGVAKLHDLSWIDDARRDFFNTGLESFSVRDFRSLEMVQDWKLSRIPRLSFYPERTVEPDFSVADMILPHGRKLLGISIINTTPMRQALEADRDRVQAVLQDFKGWAVIPIVSTMHQTAPDENDASGFLYFADMFLRGFDILAQEMLDHRWWYSNLTPSKLKGVVARLDTLLSQRKHNCVHAIGSSVRVLGIHPCLDDSLLRTFYTLSNYLQEGSQLIPLFQPSSRPKPASAGA
jgi:hypothetical protein